MLNDTRVEREMKREVHNYVKKALTDDRQVDQPVPGGRFEEVHPAPVKAGIVRGGRHHGQVIDKSLVAPFRQLAVVVRVEVRARPEYHRRRPPFRLIGIFSRRLPHVVPVLTTEKQTTLTISTVLCFARERHRNSGRSAKTIICCFCETFCVITCYVNVTSMSSNTTLGIFYKKKAQ